jgi:3-carboxy-cis,cis-muconate cycloisomerase
MIAVFDDAAIVQGMFRFEEALSQAQADEGLLSPSAARAIAGVCNAQLYDIPAMISAGRRAGSLAIPLVKELTKTVACTTRKRPASVHWGSTSQDVIDTAMVLATRDALQLLDDGLHDLTGRLLRTGRPAHGHAGAGAHADAAGAGDQLRLQADRLAGATGVRARACASARTRALQLQLGGAVGTLAVMGDKGPAVAGASPTP